MKKILLFLLSIFITQSLTGQTLPKITETTLSLSQGNHRGFVLLLPNVNQEMTLKAWKNFTYLMFPILQPGEEVPKIPVTRKDDFNENEYRTTGIYFSQLSQNPVNVSFTLVPAEVPVDSVSTGLLTKMSMAVDFGNNNFLDTDNYFQVEAAKHLLYRFYLRVRQDFPD